MAIPIITVSPSAPSTPTAFSAPTASEVIEFDTPYGPHDRYLWVKVGATETDVTVARPIGDDLALEGLQNAERIIPLTPDFWDEEAGTDIKGAKVTFSQVTGVTAALLVVGDVY